MTEYRKVRVGKDGRVVPEWQPEGFVYPDMPMKVVPADAIVIERSELPEVREHGGGLTTDPGPHGVTTNYMDAERLRHEALRYVALAEHLREHPPVDEAQVAALTSLIRGEQNTREVIDAAPWIARRLVQAGVRAPERAS